MEFHIEASRPNVHIARLLPTMWSVNVPTKAATVTPMLSFVVFVMSFDQTASGVEKISATIAAIMCMKG